MSPGRSAPSRRDVILRVLGHVALADVRRRPARAVVAVSTIALGAAALATAFVLGASMRTAINTGLTVEYAGVDVVDKAGVATGQDAVSTGGAGAEGFSATDQHKIGRLPQVAAYGTSYTSVAVAQVGDVTRGLTLDSPSTYPAFRWQGWSSGRPPQSSDEIGLTSYTLGQLGIRLGDQVAISQPGIGRFIFRVVGVVDTRGALQYQRTMYGVAPAGAVRHLSGLSAPNLLLVKGRPGTDMSELVNRINAVAPRGLPQTTSDILNADKSLALTQINAMNAVVAGLAGVASLVAAVTAMTTAGASLAARRRSWALLRCVGADRRYVAGMVSGEAVLVGLLGGVIGVAGGVGLARAAAPLVGLVPGLPALRSASFTVPGYAVWVPLCVALALAAAGAVVPAWLAARIPPSAALQATAPRAAPPSRLRIVVALLVAVGGAVAALVGAHSRSGPATALGVVAMLVGFLLLLAVVLMGVARLAVTAVSGADRRLGLLDVVRRPRAATIEAVAVTLAVGMIAMSMVCLASVQAATSARLDRSTSPDLMVGLVTGAPIAQQTVTTLAAVPGVAAAVPVTFGSGISVRGRGSDGHVVLTTGTAGGSAAEMAAGLPFGSPVPAVRNDTIYILSSGFPPFYARQTVALVGPHGRVAGLHVRYVDDLPVPTLVSRATLAKVSGPTSVNEVWLKLAAGADRARVLDQVTGIAILGGQLQVSGATILDLRVESAFATARAAAIAILAIAVLVAVIGAAATAALSVNERARTHAMLRAIGLERTSLTRMLAIRLTVVATVAACFGVLVGGLIGVVAGSVVAHTIGLSPHVVVPVLPIAIVVVLTVVAVRIAALVPVERASYIPPSRALSQA
ncbi:FtsX-like permease family protein [Nocardioides ultimimeridianus]